MTALSDFIRELAVELDRPAGGPLLLGLDANDWIGFVKLLTAIDRDETPEVIAIRRQMERIVIRRNLPFQVRCRRMLPLLLPSLSRGSLRTSLSSNSPTWLSEGR